MPNIQSRQTCPHSPIHDTQECDRPSFLSQSLFPTPPQTEAAVTYQQECSTPELNSRRLISEGDVTLSSTNTLLAKMERMILCSACKSTFNWAVICNDYLIQLNRPIQCACGCVLCTLCYRKQAGCREHNVSSKRATLNTTANNLASCPEVEHLGEWDLDINSDDQFQTDLIVMCNASW